MHTIPSVGFEISILFIVKKGDSKKEVLEKVEGFLRSYYIEPNKMVVEKQDEEMILMLSMFQNRKLKQIYQ